MKRILSLILVIVLCVTYLASCSKPSDQLNASDITDSESASETLKSETSTEQPTEKPTDNKSNEPETPKGEEPSVPCNHVYDNACDADCNECKVIRKVPEHVYDNYCDVDCNECKAIRKVPNHVYDNACDADCNECKVIRQVPDHVYDNDFDVDCNECKAVRELSDLVVTVPPTNFAAKFSPENEALLETILAKPIKNVSVENILPSLTVKPSKKYASGDGGYTYIYGNVGKAIYDNTCYVLFKNGFAKYTENAINASANDDATWKLYNYSATFINDTAQIDIDLHTGSNRMFINVTPRTSSVLPQREAKSYVKPQGNYPTLWVQYGLEDIDDKESSLGYIIRIADGTFVIIDGGEYIDGVEVRMYEILKKLAPDPNNIVISAWIITHSHADHVGGFLKFAIKYVKDPTIKVKQLVCNFPDDTKISGEWDRIFQDRARDYSKNLGAEFLKVHTGNVLYYADIKINILYTQANYLDSNTNGMMSNFNGASVVTQFVMADGSKVLVGADHPVDGTYDGAVWCQNALVRWYGTGLRSQVVSTFHHGYGGGADNYIYGVIKPKMVLWPVDGARATDGSLTTVAHNKYFTTNGKANGVTYHMASGSSVTILQFANGTPTLTFYSTFAKFKAS